MQSEATFKLPEYFFQILWEFMEMVQRNFPDCRETRIKMDELALVNIMKQHDKLVQAYHKTMSGFYECVASSLNAKNQAEREAILQPLLKAADPHIKRLGGRNEPGRQTTSTGIDYNDFDDDDLVAMYGSLGTVGVDDKKNSSDNTDDDGDKTIGKFLREIDFAGKWRECAEVESDCVAIVQFVYKLNTVARLCAVIPLRVKNYIERIATTAQRDEMDQHQIIRKSLEVLKKLNSRDRNIMFDNMDAIVDVIGGQAINTITTESGLKLPKIDIKKMIKIMKRHDSRGPRWHVQDRRERK